MASLVQDVWLGWEPRLRALRLAPWDEPRARLVFHLDAGVTLDDARLTTFLEAMAERLEVIAWEPRGQGASGGRFGPEVLDDARRLVSESAARWGALPLVVGGHGLGGWLALALASVPGVAAAFALAPSLAGAGEEPSSPLRAALVNAFARPSRSGADTRARGARAARGRSRGRIAVAPPVSARRPASWPAAPTPTCSCRPGRPRSPPGRRRPRAPPGNTPGDRPAPRPPPPPPGRHPARPARGGHASAFSSSKGGAGSTPST